MAKVTVTIDGTPTKNADGTVTFTGADVHIANVSEPEAPSVPIGPSEPGTPANPIGSPGIPANPITPPPGPTQHKK